MIQQQRISQKIFIWEEPWTMSFPTERRIAVMPRNYPLAFRFDGRLEHHYAIIGMAHMVGFPLYYDAVNEKGLGMAGLNFVGNAVYQEPKEGCRNVAQFEFIPWILSQCATLAEAKSLLEEMNLTGTPYSEQLPSAQLHWIIADATGAITVESVADGLKVYENPVGVLTNNPPFETQMFLLNNYMNLSAKQPENHFAKQISLQTYSRAWAHWDFREICLRHPGLREWHLQSFILFPMTQRKIVSVSFSISLAQSISKEDAVR